MLWLCWVHNPIRAWEGQTKVPPENERGGEKLSGKIVGNFNYLYKKQENSKLENKRFNHGNTLNHNSESQ